MSNDNPHAEAAFKTLKYQPTFPDRFDTRTHAATWMREFEHWYCEDHHHTALGLMTLAAVHFVLATYDSSRIHGATLTLEDIEAVVARLASTPLEHRRQIAGLAPERADVIVAGGCVVLEVLRGLGATSLRVSDRGVRWGLAERLLDPPER